ncbi:hypothetical protein CAI16_06495 [Virgibacillus dokdonensis]|uniref:Uncharacterized protein n=1 Tax=Virgibacillus dokdonensis TaxID=302167 RepID=A0A3E0WV54_9BACI|nr:hypothetical protein CAI16_06495 [Virgibacillus dokdonensis]
MLLPSLEAESLQHLTSRFYQEDGETNISIVSILVYFLIIISNSSLVETSPLLVCILPCSIQKKSELLLKAIAKNLHLFLI